VVTRHDGLIFLTESNKIQVGDRIKLTLINDYDYFDKLLEYTLADPVTM